MTTQGKLIPTSYEDFDDENSKNYSDMPAKDIDGWNSLSHASLIISNKLMISIRLSLREMMAFINVGGFFGRIDKKCQKY